MLRKIISMRDCLTDPNYLGGTDMLGDDSWRAWRIILIAAMGEALDDDERVVFKELTGGREREPGEQVDELTAIVGRRGGKSRAIAGLAAYLGGCVDHRHVLAPGQVGLIPVLSASKDQAREILNYAQGIFRDAPGFKGLLKDEPTIGTIALRSRVAIEIRAANFRRARGFTAVGAIGDEVCFWMSDESAQPDREIIGGLRPALATTGGPLVMISSPYARRGEVYSTFRQNFGADGDPRVLVIKAASRTMNPSLSQRVVDRAYETDPIAAASEWGGEFRSGIDAFISEEVVDPCVMSGVFEIAPSTETRGAVGFVDPASGSGGDSMTAGIARRDKDGCAVLLCALERRPPFNPTEVTASFCETFKRYGIHRVQSDRWGLGFVEAAFKEHGVTVDTNVPTKSDLYRELIPALNAGKVRMLDNKRLRTQLLQLERKTSRSGKDSIDHPPNGHDDLINAACGALVRAYQRRGFMHISQEAINEVIGAASNPFAGSGRISDAAIDEIAYGDGAMRGLGPW